MWSLGRSYHAAGLLSSHADADTSVKSCERFSDVVDVKLGCPLLQCRVLARLPKRASQFLSDLYLHLVFHVEDEDEHDIRGSADYTI